MIKFCILKIVVGNKLHQHPATHHLILIKIQLARLQMKMELKCFQFGGGCYPVTGDGTFAHEKYLAKYKRSNILNKIYVQTHCTIAHCPHCHPLP